MRSTTKTISDKKRICFISPTHWSSSMGGAEYQMKCIIEILLKTNRYEIYYLARNVNGNFIAKGYDIVQIVKPRNFRKYGYFLDTIPLLKTLKEIKPDIIYQRVGCAYTGIAAFYKRRFPCRLIWHIAHDLDVRISPSFLSSYKFHHIIESKILEYGIKNADHIIAQTETQKHDLLYNHAILVNDVIRNFHPEPNKERKFANNSKVTILWVANLKKMKQPEIFIKLAKDVSKTRKNAKFLMIGMQAFWDPGWQCKIEEMIAGVNALDYLGPKSIDEVNEYMSSADIFVSTSKMEGFPNTFIQAWMRSVPVISLHVDPDSILTKHNIGILSCDYENLLQSVLDLIDNEKRRKNMGALACKYARANHSLRNIDKIIRIFDRI